MSLSVCIGGKSYEMEHLNSKDKAYLKKFYKNEWDNFVDKLKAGIEVDEMDNVSKNGSLLAAKAFRILKEFGNKNGNVTQYTHEGISIIFESSSSPVFQSSCLRISENKKSVFTLTYACSCHASPHYDETKFVRGKWEKKLDDIWEGCCEALRTNIMVMFHHFGSPIMFIFDKEISEMLKKDK